MEKQTPREGDPNANERRLALSPEQALAERLRSEARPLRGEADERLQARIMQAIDDGRGDVGLRQEVPRLESLRPAWLALAACGAVAAAVIVMVATQAPRNIAAIPGNTSPARSSPAAVAVTVEPQAAWPSEAMLPLDVVTTRDGLTGFATRLDRWAPVSPEAVRFGGLNHDAQLAAQFVLGPLPAPIDPSEGL